jgi:hypothetical protein
MLPGDHVEGAGRAVLKFANWYQARLQHKPDAR